MPKKAEPGPRIKDGQTYVVEAEERERDEAEADVRRFLKKAGVELPKDARVRIRPTKQTEREA